MSFVSDEQLLQLLFNTNKWWTTGKFPEAEKKETRRFAFYEAKKYLFNPKLKRAVLFTGLRRVGKTTILYQLIEELLTKGVPAKNILYVSFDHPMIKICSINRILDVFKNNVAQGEELYLFFDELHYAEEWNFWLKTLVDHYPYYKIAATGSASPLLAVKGAETGVGRWVDIKIPTLSFYEYCQLKKIPLPSLPATIKPTQLHALKPSELTSVMHACSGLLPPFHRYLLIGGFPELALLDDLTLSQKLLREDIVDKVLKRDMTAIYSIRNINELEKLFIFLCLQSGNIITIQSLSQQLGTSRPTVENYIKLLSMANIIYISDLIDNSGKKALKSKPKIYLADAAIRNAVLLKDESILADSDEMGMVVETAVYKHIAAFYYNQQPKVGYWRGGKKDKEIDVVVALPNGTKILAEIKYRETIDISLEDGIVGQAKDRNTWALIITKKPTDYGTMTIPAANPLVKIPAFVFLFLLGHAEREGYRGCE
ncbi:MAG: ATP-binding protein [Clostridia bacterium]|nr:ATP-binding protein [Clostridia bacterium]